MSTIGILIRHFDFQRVRTLGLLERIEKESDASTALGWRPGSGRAHIGWQLMHVGITEEIFATERLCPTKPGAFKDLWPRFRGGSTPDDRIPTPAEIRQVLADSREHLRDTLLGLREDQLGTIPEAFKERGLTLLEVLHIIGFHEAHHQGQAHLTFNLFKIR
ncbi:MAG: DinB family protein [Planctomycetes bacterium]|nr:DinB family protein [Planctomycetota bacterium]